MVQGGDAVGRIVVLGELVEPHRPAIVQAHFAAFPRLVRHRDLLLERHEVRAVHDRVVLAHVVEALGRVGMVVESHARRDDVEEGEPPMREPRLDEGHELILVAREPAGHEGGAELESEAHEVDRIVGVDLARLAPHSHVGGRGELPLGEPVGAVVLHDVEHVDLTAHRMGELPEPDGGGIPVSGHPDVVELVVREVRAGCDGRHPAVHGVEAVGFRQEVVGRLGRAADPR